MSFETTNNLKLVFLSLGIYKTPIHVVHEVILACDILNSVTDKRDLATSSRWMREMGDMKKRKMMLQVGPEEFQKTEGTADSVVVANYVKQVVRGIELGLIPEPIQKILNWLLSGGTEIDQRNIECVSALIRISSDRFEILKALIGVVTKIFLNSEQSIDPSALASVIPVGGEVKFDALTNADALKLSYEVWHKTFGIIISHPDIYLSQVNVSK